MRHFYLLVILSISFYLLVLSKQSLDDSKHERASMIRTVCPINTRARPNNPEKDKRLFQSLTVH